MESKKNIDYILDAVIARGYNDNSSECNDFVELIQKKDFKDLIALELYETYFWNERHEFDLQLLKEIVDSVATFFNDPETIMQIKTGLLQTLPSVMVVALITAIWEKIKTIVTKQGAYTDENSNWIRLKRNMEKIDKEFSSHDYVFADEIEQIFDTNRDEIQPLLKLCGCKCFFDKKRSIWIKAGLQDKKIKEILEKHNFKYR